METPGLADWRYERYVRHENDLRRALLDEPRATALFEQAVGHARRARSLPALSDERADCTARIIRCLGDAEYAIWKRELVPLNRPAVMELLFWKLFLRLRPDEPMQKLLTTTRQNWFERALVPIAPVAPVAPEMETAPPLPADPPWAEGLAVKPSQYVAWRRSLPRAPTDPEAAERFHVHRRSIFNLRKKMKSHGMALD